MLESTRKRLEEIYVSLMKGQSLEEIAERFNVTPTTIQRDISSKIKKLWPERYQALSELASRQTEARIKERMEKIYNYMMETNSSIVKTAEYLKISPATVENDIHNRIKEAWPKRYQDLCKVIEKNTSGFEEIDRINRKITALEELQKGRSLKEVSEEFGVSKATIWKDTYKEIKAHYSEEEKTRLRIQNEVLKMAREMFMTRPDFITYAKEHDLQPEELRDTFNDVLAITNYEVYKALANMYSLDEDIKER